MIKLLHFSIICFGLMISSTSFAQHDAHVMPEMHIDHDHHDDHDEHHTKCESSIARLTSFSELEECSPSFLLSASLIDIITSDEGADLNCSGGFCMIKSHYHKKGITSKRQRFDYFMRISG